MSADEGNKLFHLEDGIPVFNTKLDDIKRKQEATNERENVYKTAQIALDRKMVLFTGLLVVCSIITGGIGVWQARISSRSADAAHDSAVAAAAAADIASDTLKELRLSPRGESSI